MNSTEHPQIEKVEPGLETFVPDFLKDREREFNQLKQDCLAQNWKDAKALVHKWKGICKPYGFGHLGEFSEQLEDHLINGQDDSKIKSLLEEIEAYLKNKSAKLNSLGTGPS